MSVTTLPLIVPNFFTGNEKRGRSSVKRPLSLSESKEVVSYWTSLIGKESRYEWMDKVKKGINISVKNDMSVVVWRHLEDAMERFADENLTALELARENFVGSEQEDTNFGYIALSIWTGFEAEEIEKDSALQQFKEDLDQCYYLYAEGDFAPEELYCMVTTVVFVRFLEEVVRIMNQMTLSKTITLFYCLHVEKTDPRFYMFANEHIEDGLFPLDSNNSGYTVEKLRINLADFIKIHFSQQPSLEDGVLHLLAGASHIIEESPESTKLNKIISKKLNISQIENEFLNLHRYILYLTFENIQKRLWKRGDKTWTVALVLDSLNQAVISYREKLAELAE